MLRGIAYALQRAQSAQWKQGEERLTFEEDCVTDLAKHIQHKNHCVSCKERPGDSLKGRYKSWRYNSVSFVWFKYFYILLSRTQTQVCLVHSRVNCQKLETDNKEWEDFQAISISICSCLVEVLTGPDHTVYRDANSRKTFPCRF